MLIEYFHKLFFSVGKLPYDPIYLHNSIHFSGKGIRQLNSELILGQKHRLKPTQANVNNQPPVKRKKTKTNKTKGRILFLNLDKFPHLVHHTASSSSCICKSDSANQNENKQHKVEAVEADTSTGQNAYAALTLH